MTIDHTRRNFLALAGAGAATVGIAGSTTIAALSAPVAGAPPTVVPANVTGSLVALIDDVHGDEVSLLIGDDEVILRDRELVARLARAAAKPSALKS
jgi:hypothetical protein